MAGARLYESDTAKFLLRVSFFPPSALFDEVMNIVYPFLDGMQRNLIKLLNKATKQGEFSHW